MSDIRRYMKERNNVAREDDDERSLERKLRRHKMGKASKWIILLVLIVASVVGYIIYYNNKVYTEYEVLDSVDIEESYNSRFFEFGEYMLRYSEDGLAYLNGNETHWNQAFEMREPVIDVCGNYVAIAEQKSNEVYISDIEATQGKIETEFPIIGLDVSGNGIVAAITEEKSDVSHIEVIGKDGTAIAKGQTVLAGQGCPVDLSISEDGTKLVVSYLYVGSGVIQSKIVFYNYSEVGKNEVDRFVGGFNFDKTMIAKVEFISNDLVAAFGDDKVIIYSMKEKPALVTEIAVEDRIKSIFYCADYIGMVVERGQGDDPYTMAIYDTEGNVVSETSFNFQYKDIKIENETVILYNDNTLKVYTVKGKEKYEGVFDEGITSIIMLEDKYNYLMVSSSSIKEIKLK